MLSPLQAGAASALPGGKALVKNAPRCILFVGAGGKRDMSAARIGLAELTWRES
jgi:hypothetical protein